MEQRIALKVSVVHYSVLQGKSDVKCHVLSCRQSTVNNFFTLYYDYNQNLCLKLPDCHDNSGTVSYITHDQLNLR